MSFLGQLGEYMSDWRQIDKFMKECERIPPRAYGELLQKKRHRGKSQRKKRRGRKRKESFTGGYYS